MQVNSCPVSALAAYNRPPNVHHSRYADRDIWITETARGIASRFTADAADDIYPVWSPDGSQLIFGSNRKGEYDLYQKLSSGTEAEQVLLESPLRKLPVDWSSDGRFVLYTKFDEKFNPAQLWVLSLHDQKTVRVTDPLFEGRMGQFSPDVRWIAYQSNETGRFEIYAQPFPGPGAKIQISTDGGTQPRWRHDGKEIFYIRGDNKLMAAPIATSSNGQTIEARTPVELFAVPLSDDPYARGAGKQYAVSPDDQRFLVLGLPDQTVTPPITVVLNWTAALNKK